MIKKKEVLSIILAIIIMTIVINFNQIPILLTKAGILTFLMPLAFSSLIILSSVCVKKFVAYKLDIEIEHKILGLKRYGFYKRSYLKKPAPIGLFLPLLISLATSGHTKIFTLLQFNSEALPSKAVKKRGGPNMRIKDITESDLGLISFCGLAIVIIIALVSNYLNIALLAKYAVYYAIANILPLFQLDGLKLLMSAGEPVHMSSPRGQAKLVSPLYFLTLVIIIIVSLIVLL